MWIVYYAEKYLKIKSKSIVLQGDSAGGHFAINVTSLAVMKNIRIPDKLLLLNPCCEADKQKFTPSLLLSVDDVTLNNHHVSI